MKFSCERSAIMQAAFTASRATAPKSPVPALEGLLIEATADMVRVTGYDLKMGIISEFEADVTEPGTIVLRARLFCDIIRALPEDTVTITVGSGMNTRVECGTSVYDIVGSPAADYPALPPLEGQSALKIDGKTLREMINQTIFAVSVSEAKAPIQTGALFEVKEGSLTVVAIDGYRLALRREPLDADEPTQFVVPGPALSEVERIAASEEGEILIVAGQKHVIFKMPQTLLVSRRLEGEFYNYRTALPESGRYTLLINRRDFMTAVERVSLIISDKSQSRGPLQCMFGDGKLSLLAVSAIGRASDECEITGDGEKLEMRFNNKFLLDALRAAPSDDLKLRLSTARSAFLILPEDDEDDRFTYMVLPLTPPATVEG